MTVLIAGVDEAGRGPLAGPVVCAAVVLDPARKIEGLADSKKLSEEQRDRLEPDIRANVLAYSIIEVSAARIDEINIFQATMEGMRLCLENLLGRGFALHEALIDGNKVPKGLSLPMRAIVKGDQTEPAISAASILAKTQRDRLLLDLDKQFPGYGFAKHKGYPTPEHLKALEQLGPCVAHRRSYAPVRKLLQPELF
jgi:ribonuclease HII